MNNSYLNNQVFPGSNYTPGNNQNIPQGINPPLQQNTNFQNTLQGIDDFEQSYIENILRLNKGKKVEVFATYPDATEWRDRSFKGIIEESGRDHLILSDPSNGNWYLILMIYINFIKFDERINYSKDFTPNNLA